MLHDPQVPVRKRHSNDFGCDSPSALDVCLGVNFGVECPLAGVILSRCMSKLVGARSSPRNVPELIWHLRPITDTLQHAPGNPYVFRHAYPVYRILIRFRRFGAVA